MDTDAAVTTSTALALAREPIPGSYSDTQLTLLPNLPIERWESILVTLGRLGRSVQWWLGDAINYGEDTYGEVYAQFLNLTGYSYGTLRNLAYTARQIPPEARRASLDFEHHREVAALPLAAREAILDQADPALNDDEKLPAAAVRQLVREAQRAAAAHAAPALPDGVYDVLLADPPWRHDAGTTDPTRTIELTQYGTLSTTEIAAHPLPQMAPASVCFLWATVPLLPDALSVLAEWGYRYVSSAVWDKERIGLGYWWRNQHEILLTGVSGDAAPPDPAARPPSVIRAPRGAHSAKPPAVHALIEQMYPAARRVEMFARAARDGWAVWGAEVAPVDTEEEGALATAGGRAGR